MEGSGLSNKEISSIQAVFSNYRQIKEVLLYGSRAMGDFKPASDIDLALKGENIDLSLQSKIEFDLDDLMFPCKFDITIYEKIKNPELLEHINRIGKSIYKRENVGNEAF